MSQKRLCTAGSHVSITIRPATRWTSASPARQSVQWWIVKMAERGVERAVPEWQVLGDPARGRCGAAAVAAPSMTGDGSRAATTGPAVS